MAVGHEPYGRMLSGICSLRLHIQSVNAEFKYNDHNPIQHRQNIARRLDQRAQGRGRGTAAQQRRRLAGRGEWRAARQRAVTR